MVVCLLAKLTGIINLGYIDPSVFEPSDAAIYPAGWQAGVNLRTWQDECEKQSDIDTLHLLASLDAKCSAFLPLGTFVPGHKSIQAALSGDMQATLLHVHQQHP